MGPLSVMEYAELSKCVGPLSCYERQGLSKYEGGLFCCEGRGPRLVMKGPCLVMGAVVV